jgi:hypothetical protein
MEGKWILMPRKIIRGDIQSRYAPLRLAEHYLRMRVLPDNSSSSSSRGKTTEYSVKEAGSWYFGGS